MKFVFADGEKLGVYTDGKTEFYESSYIRKYKENALRDAKNKEWKKKTDVMMSEEYYFDMEDPARVDAMITGVSLGREDNEIVYSFCVNETSGIYYKDFSDKEKTETHFLSSNDADFSGICNHSTGELLGVVQTRQYASNIAVFSKNGGDYKCVTEGDSLDENPSLDTDGNILFNSYAVCRDADNVFVGYMPSEIYKLDLRSMQTELLVTDGKYSYIKPVRDGSGNLYCIRKPDDKGEGNIFLDILLIPVRIVQAIVGFISAFVMCFAQKPLISGSSARSLGDGEVSKNKGDNKKVFVNNHLLNVEKELKRNKKYAESGFIPRNWVLVRLEPNEKGGFDECAEYEIAKGVADYALIEENGEKSLIYTNGKHIFGVKDFGKDGKKEKLCNVEFCLKVGAKAAAKKESVADDWFDNL